MKSNNTLHRTHAAFTRAGLVCLIVTLGWSCSGVGTDVPPGTGPDVAMIALNPPSASVIVGGQKPLQAIVTDVNGNLVAQPTIVWSVRDPNIASISQTGVVQGLAIGVTEIAASMNGKSGIGTITVQKTPVASVVVRPSHIDAVPGGRNQLTGIVYDAAQNALADRPVTWTSSNETIATVDGTGMVTARAVGTATITGTTEGKSDVSTVSVTQAPIATLTVSPNPVSMSVGQNTQFAATARDTSGNVLSGRTIAWTSSNAQVAKVSAAGLVSALTAGATTITATSEGKTATSLVSVSNFAVGTVTIQPQNPAIDLNGSTQLSATVRDVSGAIVTDRVVSWSSGNSAVVTITPTGLVTGVTPGGATITATSEGQTGTTVVTVRPAPVATVAVTPAAPSVAVAKTVTLTATVKDAAGTVLTNRVVSWTSSAAGIAGVSSAGVVTGVATGTASITATSEGKSASVTVTVTPKATVIIPIIPIIPKLLPLLNTHTANHVVTVSPPAIQ
jgi:uncharacterized protein YjdB